MKNFIDTLQGRLIMCSMGSSSTKWHIMRINNSYLFLTLLLMISFASVNAVLFTPALPNITQFFVISEQQAQQTMTWFLIGYALGQLIYGPIANRFGRKPALYAGIGLQIISSFICVLSGWMHEYFLLIVGRFLMAIGSGVGLKMTFTLASEYYESTVLNQKIAYLMLAFAIAPGIGIACGGVLNHDFGWESCFYAGALYGLVLLLFVNRLTETQIEKQLDALHYQSLIRGYAEQFSNRTLILGALLMGSASSFIYVFSSVAPFIGLNILGMSSIDYGAAMMLPSAGLAMGSVFSAKYTQKHTIKNAMIWGMLITMLSSIIMLFTLSMQCSPLLTLFLPMMLGYFGLSLIFPNASTLAMLHVSDKAYGSAVMSFVNMGTVAVVVLCMEWIHMTSMILLIMNVAIELVMVGLIWLSYKSQ